MTQVRVFGILIFAQLYHLYLDKDDKIGEVIKDQANEWYDTVVMDRIIDNNAEKCINDIVTKSQNISLKDSLDLIFNTKFVSSEPVKPVVTHELKKPTKNRQFTISIVFDGRFTQTFMEPFNPNSWSLLNQSIPVANLSLKEDKDFISKLALASARMDLSYIPKTFPCRESESNSIEAFIKAGLSNHGSSSTLYISGMPGTGKTATTLKIIENIK